MTRPHDKKKLYPLYILFGLFLVIGLSLLFGRYPRAGFTWPGLLFSDTLALKIILYMRLPRIVAALIIGAVLSSSGYVFQMIFGNPLVEPGFLGVSQGAAFGAAGTILLFGFTPLLVQAGAFIFAITGLTLSLLLARRFHYGGWILRLILAGIAVSALFSAGLGILKFTADPLSELQDITFWLLGGLWNADWPAVISILPVCIISLVVLFLYRWRINILALDDRSAYTSGASPTWEKRMLLLAATAGTAAAISVCGLVGWIGLIVPHISRKLTGNHSSKSLPSSMILGAGYLLVSDTIGRSLLSGEIPLGIITSFTGTVLFLLLLTAKRGLGESI